MDATIITAIKTEIDALAAKLAASPANHAEATATLAAWATKRPNGWHWIPVLTATASRVGGQIVTRVVLSLGRDFGATSNPNAPRGLSPERLTELDLRARSLAGLSFAAAKAIGDADLDGDIAKSDSEFARIEGLLLPVIESLNS